MPASRRPAGPANRVPRSSDAWLSPASYWSPSYLVGSAWIEHAPFASWLMAEHRPRTVVELGTHNGFSYFNWCESAVRLGLDTRLFAIDSWEGDEQAGFYDDSVFNEVTAVNKQYADRSVLLRGYFSDRVDDIEDDSVDLLHIDGRHGYEDVREDFELYLPKLSTRGIALFHDVHEHQEGFGVYKFWDEIAEKYPSFSFTHAHGLGVLFIGTEAASEFSDFVAAGRREPESIRADYQAFGHLINQKFIDELAGTYARGQLASILQSKAWRMTAPARALRLKLARKVVLPEAVSM